MNASPKNVLHGLWSLVWMQCTKMDAVESLVAKICIIICIMGRTTRADFTDKTISAGLSSLDGVVAAFADIDADRRLDLFLISSDGTKVSSVLWSTTTRSFVFGSIVYVVEQVNRTILGVFPDDFDSDGCWDLLVFLSCNDSMLEAKLLWGNKLTLVQDDTAMFFTGQPILIDIDGDGLSDIFGEDAETGSLVILHTSRTRNITRTTFSKYSSALSPNIKFHPVHSHSYVDIDGDLDPDLVISSTLNDRGTTFSYWIRENGFYDRVQTIKLSRENLMFVGQSTFFDFDYSGQLRHIVPVCLNANCTNKEILLLVNDEWVNILTPSSESWSFLMPTMLGQLQFPMYLRFGDMDNDGYPDAFILARQTTDLLERTCVVYLVNSPCTSTPNCYNGRTLLYDPKTSCVDNISEPLLVSIFDVEDTGKLDIVVMHKVSAISSGLLLFSNNFQNDNLFVKVIVLNGICYKDCPCQTSTVPLFAVQRGSSARYYSTFDESLKYLQVGISYQSAHFALLVPFGHMGLGRCPNYVNTFWIGIPILSGQSEWVYSSSQVIPNNQMLVLPTPRDTPSKWITKLYVTYSFLVLTCIILLASFMFMVLVPVVLLHIRDKRRDAVIRKRDSHRFSFHTI